jgi:phosphoglycolate phosphatase
MKIAPIKNLLFDLDGTLTDPVEGMTRCFYHALEQMNAPIPTRDEIQLHIGPPLRSTFSLILNTTDRALVERAVRLYRERFSTVGMFENKVYEGVPEMLAALKASSKKLFVATSKVQVYTEQILKHFDLFDYFDGVYGSAPDGHLDNKADLIRHILASESLKACETLMVGDRKYDIEGAKKNHCPAVAVTYGYGSVEELTEAGADYLCKSPNDVAALFKETPALESCPLKM